MKQVEASQILYVEMISEIASQFGCGEEVKAQYNLTAVTELDFAPVSAIIVFEMTRFLKRRLRLKSSHALYNRHSRNPCPGPSRSSALGKISCAGGSLTAPI